jgi:hypothetical protein
MSEIGIEQVDLKQKLHQEALVQASGWCGWQCADISTNHQDLSQAAFLAFEGPDKNLAGFGVYKPVLVEPHKLIMGAWSVSPGVGSEFAVAEELTKYISHKNGAQKAEGETALFYVGDSPLSAVVAQIGKMGGIL